MNFLKIEDEMKYFQKMFILRKEIENFLFEEGYMNIEPSIFEEYDEFTSVSENFGQQQRYSDFISGYNNRNHKQVHAQMGL